MDETAPQAIRKLLTDMLAMVDSSPDSLTSRYSELRDQSYELATQVRTAAVSIPQPSPDILWSGNRMVVR